VTDPVPDTNNWTFKTLQEHLISIMDERDRLYDQRFVAQERSVDAAMISAREAVEKAERAVDRRLENTNEWRQVINDLVKAQQGAGSGAKTTLSILLAVGALGITIISVIVSLVLK
jgi:hypothetical protein